MANNQIALLAKTPEFDTPLESQGKALQIRSLMNQAETQDMDMQQKRSAIERSNNLRSLMAGFKPDASTEDQASALTRAGYLTEARTVAESGAKVNKDKREADKAEMEGHFKKFELAGQIMGGVKDQATWDLARQKTAQVFGQAAADQMPAQYDPQLVEQKRTQAMTVKEQLEDMWKQKGYDRDVARDAEAARHNKASEGLTARGQNMTSGSAAAGRAQADRHFNANQSSSKVPAGYRMNSDGTMSAIKGGPADPESGGGKMTEDQGKATGWLVQAENAYKNMMAVGRDAKGNPTSAAKPGINDAIGAVPGLGGLANSLRGADRQKFIQSTSSLSEALLRAATGAGVNKDEAEQKVQELTPLYGEDPEVTRQKYEAIPLYIESLKVRAGPGAKKAAGVLKGQSAGAKPSLNDIFGN